MIKIVYVYCGLIHYICLYRDSCSTCLFNKFIQHPFSGLIEHVTYIFALGPHICLYCGSTQCLCLHCDQTCLCLYSFNMCSLKGFYFIFYTSYWLYFFPSSTPPRSFPISCPPNFIFSAPPCLSLLS